MEHKDFPAFPVKPHPEMQHDFENNFGAYGGINPTGLTKREYFAIECLKALISHGTCYTQKGEKANTPYWMAINALRYADELGSLLFTPKPIEILCPHCGCNKWSEILSNFSENETDKKLCKNCYKEF